MRFDDDRESAAPLRRVGRDVESGLASVRCTARPRDPGEIRRIYNMPGAFTAAAPTPAGDPDEAIVGPPDHWTEVLTHLALDRGFSTFVLMGKPDPEMLRMFIEDVAPRVRERVATARSLTAA